MIIIKSPREIELMRRAGRVVAMVFEKVGPMVKPGVSTLTLSEAAEAVILSEGAKPSSKGYGGFPAAICASVNEVLVHGIPSERKILQDGDIVSLDAAHPALIGRQGDAILDSFVFAARRDVIDGVWRAGRKVVSNGRHHRRDEITARYRQALEKVLA